MRTLTWTLTALTAAIALHSSTARACGGTFCDSGPVSMPVDQSGENILFVMEGGRVEAHVQIQYQGVAERFAWVIPVPALPKFEVGSEPLFQAMLNGSVPSYGFSTSRDTCSDDQFSASAGSNDSSGFGGSAGAGGAGGGVNVVQRSQAGAFEIVVLEGGTAAEVSKWLTDNKYQTSTAAPEILDEYVQKGFLFAAVKLTAGTDVNEIHPLVFSYEGTEPCVPIKLTAVAATEDMSVRTFFLGNERVVPTNYKHMTLNPVRIDWQSYGANYMEVVSRAADSPVANGQAFVTEYAGKSNVVSPSGVFSTSWNAKKLETIEPAALLAELEAQGLTYCYGNQYGGQYTGYCQYMHPLLLPLLQEYLPAPAGVSENDFYSCVSCFQDQADLSKWDPTLFAQDFDTRILQPGKHAADLLAKHPYLTRMLTTMSASEMTLDPMFHKRGDLPDVLLPGLATQRVLCSGTSVFELPTGEQIAIPPGGSWPQWDSKMPYAATIEEVPSEGDPIVLVDNRNKIQSTVVLYNVEQDWPQQETNGTCACRTVGSHGKLDASLVLMGLGFLGVSLVRRRRR
ncbi:MAG: DUF2330 domain-containing protein [Polyangiaceae bacterium]